MILKGHEFHSMCSAVLKWDNQQQHQKQHGVPNMQCMKYLSLFSQGKISPWYVIVPPGQQLGFSPKGSEHMLEALVSQRLILIAKQTKT